MIKVGLGPVIAGHMLNNPWQQEDGDPNRWCILWTINILPSICIGYNEDSKDYYRHLSVEWLGIRLSIHYSKLTGLQKQEEV